MNNLGLGVFKRAAAFQRRHGGAIASPVGESFSTMPSPASVTADESEEVRRAEMGAGEKNNIKYGLTNGESITISNDPAHPIQEYDARSFAAWIRPTYEPELPFFKARIYRGHFDDSVNYDKDRVRVDSSYKRNLVELDWGFCITCHKAQGGQYRSVLILDDCRGTRVCPDKETHRRWLYTAVTRACERVIIMQRGR